MLHYLTPAQQAAAFGALPFLALAVSWGAGLYFLIPRQQQVRIKRNRRPQ
jgi:preprotein translocase subunit YajC